MSWKYRLLLAILVLINIVLFWRSCEHIPIPVQEIIKPDTIKIIKDSIVLQEKEVIKWKKRKDSINYTTVFDTVKIKLDTLANAVFNELLKCDSIAKLDSMIIDEQGTIINEHKEIIGLQNQEIESLDKQLKKQKKRGWIDKGIELLLLLGLIIK